MALVDVIMCCLDSIRQISEHIEGAIVYLDAGCTESFQFLGAYPLLLELGAHAICSLENMSSLDMVVDWSPNSDLARKVVVFTSRLLSDAHRYVLRCLSMNQNLRHCTIFTSISEIAHSAYPDSPLGPDAFREYESLLVQDYEELLKRCKAKSEQSGESKVMENLTSEDEGWSQLTFGDEVSPLEVGSGGKDSYEDDPIGHTDDVGQKLVVSVHHYPLILCPFSPRVFVLPSEGSIAEAYLSTPHENSLSPGLPPLSTGSPPDSEDVLPGATLTAQFLYHLAAKMDLKMEIYSLGDLSKTVGKLLTDMSSLYDVGRWKRSAGLLLIDRTLDLLTPCSHGDSLIERIFSALPRRELTTSSAHMKGSHTQRKLGPVHLQRAPLDVQIPLTKFLCEEDSTTENFQLVDSIEAFLHGWNSSDFAFQTVELLNLSTKLHGEKSFHSESKLLNGSFVSAESFRGTPYLEAILDRRTKDGAILIRKWLQETLRRENLNVNVKIRPGFATKTELQPLIRALARIQSSFMRNKGIIQLAAATLYALDELHCTKWDGFISAEKMLNVSAGDTSQSLAAQISDLINKSSLVGSHGKKTGPMEPSQGLLSFQDVLLLTVYGYILAGENFPTSGSGSPFSWQEEHFMKEAIVDAVLENPGVEKLKFLSGLTEELEANIRKMKSEEAKEEPPRQSQSDDFDDDQWGNWGDEDADKNIKKEEAYGDMQLKLELRDRVDNLFKFLHKLSSMKRRNLPFREGTLGMESSFNDDPCSSKGLIYKLLTRVLGKHDIPGLEYHSSTVGRIFKSGFGRFGLGQAKPSLADQNVLLVFVIGGINGVEVREVQEALSESGRPDMELILGGTTFLTPNDLYDLLLGDSSYN
ncbi:sec1 family domain-containing protein MIP3 [Actinidia eriantha]|uniref:sec1 family domain-containing protein MIP3 n=1 Tax=Actinidia eriantha TaxID=165200 RepID=UPI00258CBD2C|nr:sec1 family domain-containing protein MIP3 [Actinidia eriantha]XP_057467030.1 sec1 family domain-containing protein MIP3 [Actinidia eriantha]XP_057467031.1 sec1 family domain-containing protein MIP3 [Actinidia eriantha]